MTFPFAFYTKTEWLRPGWNAHTHTHIYTFTATHRYALTHTHTFIRSLARTHTASAWQKLIYYDLFLQSGDLAIEFIMLMYYIELTRTETLQTATLLPVSLFPLCSPRSLVALTSCLASLVKLLNVLADPAIVFFHYLFWLCPGLGPPSPPRPLALLLLSLTAPVLMGSWRYLESRISYLCILLSHCARYNLYVMPAAQFQYVYLCVCVSVCIYIYVYSILYYLCVCVCVRVLLVSILCADCRTQKHHRDLNFSS